MLFTYIYSIDNSFLGRNLRKRFEIVCATWFLNEMHKHYWRTTKKNVIYLSTNCTTSNALLHIVKSCVLAWSCSAGNLQIRRSLGHHLFRTHILRPLVVYAVWHFRLWSFQGRDTKLERFLAKNQLYSNEITKFWELE